MALTKCRECGKEVSTAASACPHCGAKQKRKVGIVGVLAALVVGWVVFTVASGPGDISPPAIAAAPPIAQVSAPERAKIIAGATKALEASRDKMEGVTFYMAPKRQHLTPKIEAYLSVPDARPALLRIAAVYYGDDWVFFDQIKVMADDVVVYEKTLSRSDVARNNSGGSVWETADYLAQPEDEQALRKIANAKSATIRFSSRERQHDHAITAKQLGDLRKVLAARDAMKGI